MTAPAAADDTVNADPSKRFFIEMLTKDVNLAAAISDLLDNSVDGAKRASGPTGTFTGKWVHVTFSEESFTVTDNCGGIPLDIAKKYAFRFGREDTPDDSPVPGGVGRFGVGMKRALFKIGDHFLVRSRNAGTSFEVDVDVPAWASHGTWKFPLVTPTPTPPDEDGTTVHITEVHPTVKQVLGTGSFQAQLTADVRSKLGQYISKGLEISINGTPVQSSVPLICLSSHTKPAHVQESIVGGLVDLRIVAGLAQKRHPASAGWYVYCNERLILGADRTPVTGWGDPSDEEREVPQYHNDFAWFRGFVFLTSPRPDQLPWNTTKTALDLDSEIYRYIRPKMQAIMRPLLSELRRAAREQASEQITEIVTSADEVAADSVPLAAVAQIIRTTRARTVKTETNILYQRPLTKVERAKKSLGVTSNRAVGEATFEYYYDRECGN